MTRPNVLIIIPNLGSGGAQHVFHQQVQYLSGRFNVTSCVFNWDGSFKEDKNEGTLSLEVPAGRTLLGKVYCFILRIIRLRKLKREKSIDVSISHLEGADYVNVLSCRIDKTICWIHGTKFHDAEIRGSLGWLRRKMFMPLLYRRVKRIVTVSEGIRLEFTSTLRIPEGNIQVINNGFDIDSIERKSKDQIPLGWTLLFEKYPAICLCSRLALQKNHDAFLSIFAEVLHRLKCKLIILGDGECRDALLRQANVLALKVYTEWDSEPFTNQYDVYFLGNQKNPFMYISHASLFALPSAWEGFPLALCEAMICNVPVIASDCPTGPREILKAAEGHFESDCGLLLPVPSVVKDNSFYSWVDAVLLLLNDRQRAFDCATKAKSRMTDFGIDKIQPLWIDVIESILDER